MESLDTNFPTNVQVVSFTISTLHAYFKSKYHKTKLSFRFESSKQMVENFNVLKVKSNDFSLQKVLYKWIKRKFI